MIDVLSPIIGEQAARIVILAAILLLIAALALVVVGLAFRIFRGRSFGFRGSRSRAPRLSVPDVMPVDSRRKLILVRRDTVEHLLLVGGATDLVIETAIQRAVQPANRGRPVTAPPAVTSGPTPPAPLAAGTAPGQPPRPAAVRPAPSQPAPAARPQGPRPVPVAVPMPARTQPQPVPVQPSQPMQAASPPQPAAPIQHPRAVPPQPAGSRMPPPAGRAAFPVAAAASVAAPPALATPIITAAPPPPPPGEPEAPDEVVETVESEASLENSRAALAEAIERDFESMVPSEPEPSDAAVPASTPELSDKPPEREAETESAERLSNRENEMAQLLGEIFGKK
jgi:flagellar protein FliO/FliZ